MWESNEETLRAGAPVAPPWNLLNIRVLPDRTVSVDRLGDAWDPQFATIDQVEEILANQHAANENTVAVLLAGTETPYRYVYEALGAIQQSPVTRYSIQLDEEG